MRVHHKPVVSWGCEFLHYRPADPLDTTLTDPMRHAGFRLDKIEVRCTPCALTGHGILRWLSFAQLGGNHRLAGKWLPLGTSLDIDLVYIKEYSWLSIEQCRWSSQQGL